MLNIQEMHTIARSDLPYDIFFCMSEMQRMGVWRILELNPDHAIFYRKGAFTVMIARRNDFMFETFETREKASNFALGMLV